MAVISDHAMKKHGHDRDMAMKTVSDWKAAVKEHKAGKSKPKRLMTEQDPVVKTSFQHWQQLTKEHHTAQPPPQRQSNHKAAEHSSSDDQGSSAAHTMQSAYSVASHHTSVPSMHSHHASHKSLQH